MIDDHESDSFFFFFLFLFPCSPVRHDVTQTDIGRRRKVYNPPLSKLSIYLPTIFIRHLIEVHHQDL